MSAVALLHEQDWKRLTAKLTAYAYRRICRSSWELARDLAQSAITDLFLRPQSWSPEKEPLLKHLAKRVIGLARNEWTRKRTSLEVLFDRDDDEDLAEDEQHEATLVDRIDRQRLGARFRAGIDERLAGDENALTALDCMSEGLDAPLAIAEASGVPLPQVKEARRRVFYHAEILMKQMGEELDAADDAAMDEEEVA